MGKKPGFVSESQFSTRRAITIRDIAAAMGSMEAAMAWLGSLTPAEKAVKLYEWEFWARPEQYLPTHRKWIYWACIAGRGFGKALALDTPIATPSGWSTMGLLRAGDFVFDEWGAQCRVLAAHPVQIGRPCFKVKFSDGSTIIADEDHLWTTIDRRARKAQRRSVSPQSGPHTLTTREIAASLYDGKEVNHAIPCAGPLQCADAVLPIDPYLLGIWLGDGSSNGAEITTADPEIVEAFEAAGFRMTARKHGNSGLAETYSIAAETGSRRCATTGRMIATGDALRTKLATLGVLGRKHVPPLYLRASAAQRLALLQGLFDTDGYCSAKTGSAEFCSTSKDLAAGARELALSLGFKAVTYEGRATLSGRDCGPKYRVCFTAHRETPIFRLARKVLAQPLRGAQADRAYRRYIVAVEPVPSVPVRCITVDSPSRLYLAGDAMIATHNTRTGAEAVRQWIKQGFRYVNLIGATFDDAEKIMVSGESGILAICPPAERPRWISNKKELRWPNGAISLVFSAEEPDRLRGKQSDKIWCDELACVVAGTLVRTSAGERPIETISIGDLVWTRKGLRRVADAWQSSPSTDVWEVETSTGATLIGTPNHPVFAADNGFVPLAFLRSGVILETWDQNQAVGNAGSNSIAPTLERSVVHDNAGTAIVVRLRKLPLRMAVYNLSVEGEEEYYANGLLVHNSWRYADTWDQAQLGLRLGREPQAVITTTPRATTTIKDLLKDPETIVTMGSTYANKANLSKAFIHKVIRKYEGTRMGRQELLAELLEDVPGALWNRALIDKHRINDPKLVPVMRRIVVAIDPAASSGKNDDGKDNVVAADGFGCTGIVAAGIAENGQGYVLADLSGHFLPHEWAKTAIARYHLLKADRIVAERNNGGDMVESTIRMADKNVPVTLVWASKGKFTRAEPISMLYEQGLIHHVGTFPQLEDQMCAMTPDFDRKAAGYSPDRLDAMVWAFTELMVGYQQDIPIVAPFVHRVPRQAFP